MAGDARARLGLIAERLVALAFVAAGEAIDALALPPDAADEAAAAVLAKREAAARAILADAGQTPRTVAIGFAYYVRQWPQPDLARCGADAVASCDPLRIATVDKLGRALLANVDVGADEIVDHARAALERCRFHVKRSPGAVAALALALVSPDTQPRTGARP